VTFQHCVITKVALVGSGEESPKELLEFSYGVCEYAYQEMHGETGKPAGNPMRAGWSAIQNKEVKLLQEFNEFRAS
jgi:hypothetical protein